MQTMIDVQDRPARYCEFYMEDDGFYNSQSCVLHPVSLLILQFAPVENYTVSLTASSNLTKLSASQFIEVYLLDDSVGPRRRVH
jgi:hypothetical protein